MTNEYLVAEVRRQHRDTIHISEPTCDFCLHDFPCDAIRLADALEQLEATVERLWKCMETASAIIGFLSCTVKSGEQWTSTCEERTRAYWDLRAALAKADDGLPNQKEK